MPKCHIIYNKLAGNGSYKSYIDLLASSVSDQVVMIDVSDINNYGLMFSGLECDDYIILCGGDGTLNRFANEVDGIAFDNAIYYYPIGSGNDFAREMEKAKACEPFKITEYLTNLPRVTVKGKSYRFINGIGYGIDGYCCEVGDEQRKHSNKPINYAAIAIKGLLRSYHPADAKLTVDGIEYYYKDVWLAPTMYGRFYGGGMIPAPEQKRNSGQLSVMVYHRKSKFCALCVFPSLFKGKHTKYTKTVAVHSGKRITVEFDSPRSLQIDGETITNVSSYTAYL